MTVTEHKPINKKELNNILAALDNAIKGHTLTFDPADTSFVGSKAGAPSEDTASAVIDSVKSVPCHY